jgi:hypothetical protein
LRRKKLGRLVPNFGKTLKAARYGRRNIPKIPRRNSSFLARPANRRLADLGVRARLQPDPARHLHDRLFRLDRDLGRADRPQRQGTDFSINRRDSMPRKRRSSAARECPYVLDYDLVVLTVAIAFPARHGLMRVSRFRDQPAPRSGWCTLSRAVAGATGIPFGLIVPLALDGFTLRARRAITPLQIRRNG